jgi:hypothetical protein
VQKQQEMPGAGSQAPPPAMLQPAAVTLHPAWLHSQQIFVINVTFLGKLFGQAWLNRKEEQFRRSPAINANSCTLKAR